MKGFACLCQERSRSFPERRLAQPSVEKGTPCNGGTPPAWQASPASFAGQLSPMTPQEMSHSSSVPFGLARTSASAAQTAVRAQRYQSRLQIPVLLSVSPDLPQKEN